MTYTNKRALQWFLLISCCLSFTLLFSACDLFNSGSKAQSTPTAKATSTPTPTATPAPSLTAYNADTFSIGYPQGWIAKTSTSQLLTENGKVVTFSDSAGLNSLMVEEFSNPNATIPTSLLVTTATQLFKANAKNAQDANVPSSTTIGGQSWEQHAATGDVTESGVTANAKIVLLVANYPARSAKTHLFAISYSGPTLTFDPANTATFQPMLQSFKFVTA